MLHRLLMAPEMVALLLLFGCSGGGHSSLPPTSPNLGSGAGGQTTLTLKVDFPPTSSSQTRVPKYLSPATASLVYYVTSGSNVYVTNGNWVNFGSGGLATAPQCQSQGLTTYEDTTSCTITYTLSIPSDNSYTIDIATYDQSQPTNSFCNPAVTTGANKCTGNLLSESSFSDYLYTSSNTISVALNGIPASVIVRPMNSGYLQLQGSSLKLWGSSSQQVSVEALDADNNVIVGIGAPTLTLSSATPTQLQVGSASSSAPNVFTVQAQTTGSVVTPGVVNLTATATAADDSTAVTSTIPVTIAHSVLYVSQDDTANGQGDVYAFYDGNTNLATATKITIGAVGAFLYPTGVAVDTNGTLYVSTNASGGNSIFVFPAGATASSAILALPTHEYASSMAVGGDGTIYVGEGYNSEVLVFPANSTSLSSPELSIPGGSNSVDGPVGIAVDGAGTIYVANCALSCSISDVTSYAAGATSPSVLVQYTHFGNSTPYYVATGVGGTIYVSTNGGGETYEFSPPLTSSPTYTEELTPPTFAAGNYSTGIAVDASGNAYVGSYNIETSGSGVITEYPSNSSSGTNIITGLASQGAYLAAVPRAIAP